MYICDLQEEGEPVHLHLQPVVGPVDEDAPVDGQNVVRGRAGGTDPVQVAEQSDHSRSHQACTPVSHQRANVLHLQHKVWVSCEWPER